MEFQMVVRRITTAFIIALGTCAMLADANVAHAQPKTERFGPAGDPELERQPGEPRRVFGAPRTPSIPKELRRKLLYMTTRAPSASDGACRLTGQAAPGRRVRYGVAIISLPDVDMSRATFENFACVRAIPLSTEEFHQRIGLTDQPNAHVVLYVHGFKTGFHEAASALQFITNDIVSPKMPVLFAWPSRRWAIHYSAAEEEINATAPVIARALRGFDQMNAVAEMHVVAHSLGTQGVLGVMSAATVPSKLTQIALIAPDISDRIFDDRYAALQAHGKPVTVYHSEQDLVLAGVGSCVTDKDPRVGQLRAAPDRWNNIEFVHVTQKLNSPLCLARPLEALWHTTTHSYHYMKHIVRKDLLEVLGRQIRNTTRRIRELVLD